jgi:hypothetical protein
LQKNHCDCSAHLGQGFDVGQTSLEELGQSGIDGVFSFFFLFCCDLRIFLWSVLKGGLVVKGFRSLLRGSFGEEMLAYPL